MRTLPDKLTTVPLSNGTVTVDEHGYITDPGQWSDEFARRAAETENIELSDHHWPIIRFMRSFHDEHSVAPDQRFVLNLIAQQGGLDKAQARRRMYELFPYGYVKQACKIAGMRQPRAWSTG